MNLSQSIVLLILFKLSFGQKIVSPTNQLSDVIDFKKIQEASERLKNDLSKLITSECAPKLKNVTICVKTIVKSPPTDLESGCCLIGNIFKCYDDVVRRAGCDREGTQKFSNSLKEILREFGRTTCKDHSLCTANSLNSGINLRIGWFSLLMSLIFCFVLINI
jgi:hypothetical protein